MAPQLTPFSLGDIRTTRQRCHRLHIITLTIGLFVAATLRQVAADEDISPILLHYNDNDNSIYHDDVNEGGDVITSTDTGTVNGSGSMSNIETPQVFSCPAEGLHAHQYECQLYYRCEAQTDGNIKPYLLSCKRGTIFSRDLKLCMPAMLANREECQHHINEIDTLSTDDYGLAASGTSDGVSLPMTDDSSVDSRLMHILQMTNGRGGGGIANNGNAMAGTYNQWQNYSLTGLSGVSVISFSTSSARSAAGGVSAESEQGPSCRDDGFMSDPDDCTVFYRCISNGQTYNKIGFRCSDGTAWDESLQSCNHLFNVRNNGGCKDNKQGIQMDEFQQQQQTSTQASQNSQQSSTSSSSSSSQQQSSTSSSSSSSSSNSSSTQQSSSTQSSSTESSSSSSSSTQSSSASNSQQSSTSSTSTSSNSNNETSTQSSSNTNQSSVSNSQNQNSSTSNSTQSSTSQNSEGASSNNQSGAGINQNSSTNANSSSSSQNASNNNQSSGSSSSGSNKPASTKCDVENTYTPDKEDCAKFYRCQDNGNGGLEIVPFTCGPDTVWSQDEKICVSPNESQLEKCKINSSSNNNNQSGSSSNQSTSSNNQSSSTNNQSNTSTTQSGAASGSQSESSNSNNQANSSTNQQSGSSTSNQASSSNNQSNSSNNNQSNSSNNQQSGSSSNSANQSSSSSNQQGSANNQTSSGSTSEHQPKPQKPSNPDGKCTDTESYLPDKTDCTRFYRCVDNGKGSYDTVAFDCAPGTVWDPDSKSCNHPTDVQKEQCTAMANGTWSSSSSSHTQSSSSSAGANSQNQGSSSSSSSAQNQGATSSTSITQASQNTTSTIESNQSSNSTTQTAGNQQSSSSQTGSQSSSNSVSNQSSGSNQSGSSSTTTEANQTTSNNQNSTSSSSESSSNSQSTSGNQSSTSSNSQGSGNQSTQSTSTNQTITTQKPFKPAQHCESEETFLEDKEDCSKFYRCVNNGKGGYTKVSFKCPPNTIWHPQANSCDHPSQAQNLKCKMPSASNTTESNATSSSSTSGGQSSGTSSSTQSSGTSSGSQSSTSSSSTQSSASQSSGSSSSTQSSGSSTGSQSSGSSSNTQSSASSTGSQSSGSSSSNQSSGTSSNSQSSTSTSSSSSSQESATSQSSTATEGSSTSQSSSSQNTTSSSQGNTSTQGSNQSSSSSSQQSGSSSSQQSTSTSSQQNPVGNCNSNNQYLEDSQDCSKFYRCVQNSKGGYDKIPFTCGPGTVWDSQIEACNHAWAVKHRNCGTNTSGSGSETPNQQTSTNPGGTAQSTTTPSSWSTSKPIEQPPTQSPVTSKPVTPKPLQPSPQPHGICKTEGFVGDPKDCTRFYRCVDNGKGGFTEYPFRCGDGTVWDSDLQTCNHDLNKCNPNTGGQTSTGRPDIGTQKPHENTGKPGYQPTTMKPDVTTTKEPVHSTTQVSDQTSTGKPGYHPTTQIPPETTTNKPDYQPSTQTSVGTTTIKPATEYPQTTTMRPDPNSPISIQEPCPKEGFFGDKDDCKRFFRCTDNGKGGFEKHSFKCGNDTVWDAEIESCNHPTAISDPRCGEGATNYPTTTTDKNFPTTTTGKYETTTLGTTTTSKYETTTSKFQTTTTEPTSKPPTAGSTGEWITTTSSPTTTPIPNLPAGTNCKGEGFMADPENCRKFYRCSRSGDGYERHEFKCSKGTGWSEEKQTCDHRNNIPRCAGTTEEPDAETTTQEYETSSTDKYTTTTTEKYASTTVEYEKPSTTNNPIINTTTTTIYPTSTMPTETTTTSATTIDYTTTGQPTSTTPIPNLPAGITCKGEGFMADPNSCRKFYRCIKSGNGYERHEFKCSKGTGWSEEKQTCDHRDNIDRCAGQTEEPDPETTTQEYVTSTTNKYSTTTIGYEKPTDVSTTTTYKPTITTTIQYPTSTVVAETTTISSSTTDFTTTMQPPSTTPVPNLPPGKKCKGEGFMADPDNCRKFYRCIKAGDTYEKHEFKCAKGTGWNEEKQTCDYRDNIERCAGTTEQPEPETTTQEYVSSTTGKYTTTTPKYTSTTIETETPTTMPTTTYKPTVGSTTQYPTTSRPSETTTVPSTTTDYTSTMQPTSTTPIPNLTPGNKCTGEGFMADPENCRKFYRCIKSGVGYERHEFKCAKGTGWSEEKQTCDYRGNIDRCANQTEEPDPETTTQEYVTSTTDRYTPTTMENGKPTAVPTTTYKPTTTTTAQYPTSTKPTEITATSSTTTEDSTTVQPTSTTPVPNLPSGKKCKGEGFMADPDNCRIFYRCIKSGDDYERHEFKCAKGTGWSEEKQTCDYRGNINRCASQTEEPEPETTTAEYVSSTTDKYSTTTMSQTTEYENSTTTKRPSTTQNPSSTMSPETTTLSSTTAQYTTTMEPSSTTPMQSLPPGMKCMGEGFMADPDNCRKFYRCEKSGNGYVTYEFTCGKGTGWSEAKMACDHRDKVERCQGQTEAPEPETTTYDKPTPSAESLTTTTNGYEKPTTTGYETTTTVTGKPDTTTELSTTSTTHVTTSMGQVTKPTTTTESATTESYSTTTVYTTTLQPTTAPPVPNQPPGTKCEGEGFMADPNNCRKFYRCIMNGDKYERHEFMCAKGTGWSEEKQTCDYAGNIERCEGQTEEPETTTSSYESTSAKPMETTTIGKPTTSPATTNKPVHESTTAELSTMSTTTMKPTDKPGYDTTTTELSNKPTTVMKPTDKPVYETTTTDVSTMPTTTMKPTDKPGTTTMMPTDKPGYDTTTIETSTLLPTTMQPTGMPGYVPTTTSAAITETTEQYESTTSEPINHKCIAEGFFPDLEDCNRYYRCVDTDKKGNYHIYSFRCPKGTVWDTSLETCNYADQVSGNCSSGAITSTTEILTTEISTTPKPEANTTGKPEITVTEYPKDTTTTATPVITTTAESTTTEIPKETTTTWKPDITTTESPKETTTGKSETITTDIPKETTTDKPVTAIDYPSTSGKPETTTTEYPTTSEVATNTTSQKPITGQTTSQPEIMGNMTGPCPEIGEGQHLFICPTGFRRHPKNCNMFYQCTEKADSYDQNIVVFECPNGTIYHEDWNRCDEPKKDENCEVKPRTQSGHFEDEYKQSHMIQIRSTDSLCPAEGHFAFNQDDCGQLFIKCQYSSDTQRLEGQIFRCPKGFAYWSVSRRCERAQKLQNCSTTKYGVSSSIPVEWSNIGNRRRTLRI